MAAVVFVCNSVRTTTELLRTTLGNCGIHLVPSSLLPALKSKLPRQRTEPAPQAGSLPRRSSWNLHHPNKTCLSHFFERGGASLGGGAER